MIKVGTCGLRSPRSKYYNNLNVVELQETFYDLPNEDKMRQLRSEAPENFEFTVKVFQALTHSKSSPTWRKIKTKLPGNLDNYGLLRPTKENFEIWNEFLRRVKPLNAKIYIFQTPSSLPFNTDSINWIEEFFNNIKSRDLVIGWEPRGKWNENVEILKKILSKYDIIHVVDPFRREPVHYTDIVYFRLHGIGPGEVNYRYRYTDDDLNKLLKICLKYVNERCVVYVLFNNVYMYDDAIRFIKLINEAYK